MAGAALSRKSKKSAGGARLIPGGDPHGRKKASEIAAPAAGDGLSPPPPPPPLPLPAVALRRPVPPTRVVHKHALSMPENEIAFQTYVSIFTVSCRRLVLRLPLGAAAAILPRLLIAACRCRWLLLLLLLLLSVGLLPPLQVYAALHVMRVWELHQKRESSSAPSCRALRFLLFPAVCRPVDTGIRTMQPQPSRSRLACARTWSKSAKRFTSNSSFTSSRLACSVSVERGQQGRARSEGSGRGERQSVQMRHHQRLKALASLLESWMPDSRCAAGQPQAHINGAHPGCRRCRRRGQTRAAAAPSCRPGPRGAGPPVGW